MHTEQQQKCVSTGQKILDLEVIHRTYASFCQIYISRYAQKHSGVWPSLEISKERAPWLHSLHKRGEVLSEREVYTHYTEFLEIQWDKSQDISLEEDVSMFMKDEAISPLMSHWDSVFSKTVMFYTPPFYFGTRRLVQTVLNNEHIDPAEYLDYVQSGAIYQDPEYCMSYSLKEKEVNKDGRIFGKMTIKARGATVLAESLLARGIATETSWCLARHFASSRADFSTEELKVLTPRPNAINNAHRLHDTANIFSCSTAVHWETMCHIKRWA